MTTIGIVLAAAAAALGVARLSRISGHVVAIVAGVALQAFGRAVDSGVMQEALLLAGTFLVFAMGAEVERRALAAYQRVAAGVALLYIAVTSAVGALLWHLLELDGWTAVYLILALHGSSSLLVLETLRRRERFFDPIGRIVTASSVALNLVVVLVLGLLSPARQGLVPFLLAAGCMVGLAGGAWMCARWIAPYVMLRLGLDDEERMLFVLVILFGFAAAARLSGLPMVAGAYFAGLAVSRFPVGGIARAYLRSFSDFFVVVFFVVLGWVASIPGPLEFVTVATLVITVLVIRPLLLLPLVRRVGLTVRSSIEAVTLLAQAGELALVVALMGVGQGHIAPSVLGIIAVVAVLTMSAAPLWSSDRVTWWLTHWYPGRRHEGTGQASGRVLLLGCGETGEAVLEELSRHASEVVVLDEDPGVVARLEERGVHAIRGDGGSPRTLRRIGAPDAESVVSTMRRRADNERLLSACRNPRVLVRVFSDEEAERVTHLGGTPIVESEIATQAFFRWYDEQRVNSASAVWE